MVQAHILNDKQIHQGDVFLDIDYIEHADIIDGHVDISIIRYPHVIIMSQECDLTQDYDERYSTEDKKKSNDKLLHGIIVAPMYNYEHFREGKHYSNLGYTMCTDFINQNKTPSRMLKQNNNPRYHFMEFDSSIPIVDSVVDFKHFFTVDISSLYKYKKEKYVCSLDALFRERLSQRFANYLSRIGLPTDKNEQDKKEDREII